MGKEVKIGLAVIGVLLCVFGGVLAMRLKREQPANALEKVAAAEKEGKIGRKKKSIKTGKDGKADNAEPDTSLSDAALGQNISGSSRRAKPNTGPKTDRYGRPLEDNAWTVPAQGEPQDAVSEDDQAPPLNVPDTDETDGQANDRYARYADRDPLEEQPADAGEMPVEERVQDDAAVPIDRFAQRTGGISFSGDEPAEDAEDAAGDAGSHDAPERAPRFTVDSPADGSDFNSQPVEPVAEEADNRRARNRDDTGLNLPAISDDEASDDRPRAADRFGGRFRQRQDEPAMLADEERLDDAQMADDPRFADTQGGQDAAAGSYTVEANDNFWRISQKVYGTGAYFKALEEHNRRQLGNRPLLNVGDVIATPPIAELARDYPSLSPKPRDVPSGRRGAALASSASRSGRTYTVLEGDTLFDIARQELGKASRWAEIYELNREQLGEDFNYLSPGMRLTLPPQGGRTDPIATRPARESYRR